LPYAHAVTEPAPTLVRPNSARFEVLDPRLEQVWARYGKWDTTYFPNLVGLELTELRVGYCALRIPFRTEVTNPEGVVHGGVLATALDTACVPAIGTFYDTRPQMLTLQMNVNYLEGVRDSDVFAEGWVTKGTASIALCSAEVRDVAGRLAASATAVFKVRL